MPSDNLLTEKEEQHVVDAIARAENKTSGEVRVHIEDHCKGDPLKRASSVFQNLGMNHTEQKNGVLIYIASEDRKAAVFGGQGIHEQVEENFWNDVLTIILNHFKEGNFAEGLVQGIDKVAVKMKELYPHQQGDVNELSNEISYE